MGEDFFVQAMACHKATVGVDPVIDSGVGCARSCAPLFAIVAAVAKFTRTSWNIKVAVVCDGLGVGCTPTSSSEAAGLCHQTNSQDLDLAVNED